MKRLKLCNLCTIDERRFLSSKRLKVMVCKRWAKSTFCGFNTFAIFLTPWKLWYFWLLLNFEMKSFNVDINTTANWRFIPFSLLTYQGWVAKQCNSWKRGVLYHKWCHISFPCSAQSHVECGTQIRVTVCYHGPLLFQPFVTQLTPLLNTGIHLVFLGIWKPRLFVMFLSMYDE